MYQARPVATGAQAGTSEVTDQGSAERIAVALEGACSINGGADIPCASLDIATSGARIVAIADPRLGDGVKLSFRQTGILSGAISELLPSGFVVVFEGAPSARMNRFVSWLRHGRSAAADTFAVRQHARIVPLRKLARLKRASGAEILVRTIDVSRSGIAFDRRSDMTVGERVRIGDHPGTVVRLWEAGAGVAFDEVLDAEGFDVTISFA